MSSVTVNEAQLKELLKQAFLELLEERKDLFYDLFTEVMADIALVNAVRGGVSTETVSRADVLQALGEAA